MFDLIPPLYYQRFFPPFSLLVVISSSGIWISNFEKFFKEIIFGGVIFVCNKLIGRGKLRKKKNCLIQTFLSGVKEIIFIACLVIISAIHQISSNRNVA